MTNQVSPVTVVEDDKELTKIATEMVRINNFPSLEVIGPNRIFVQNGSVERNDQYSLDLSHLSRTHTAFTYRLHSDDTSGSELTGFAPISLRPTWKPKGDRLEVLLAWTSNPNCTLAQPLKLSNVVIFITYEGRATGCQTKPSGTHLRDKHIVYWRLGDVTITNQVQKIVCRVIGAEELKPGNVEARWEYVAEGASSSVAGISVGRLVPGKEAEDDPFMDAVASPGVWETVPGAYRLVAGKYEAKE